MEISINELRIGNLLNYGDGHIIVDVNILRDFHVYKGDVEPIPLTEEWLLKFGFIKLGMMNPYYRIKKIKLDINTLGVVRFHWSRKVVYLDYVHQLQNLYFALTQTELTIKEL